VRDERANFSSDKVDPQRFLRAQTAPQALSPLSLCPPTVAGKKILDRARLTACRVKRAIWPSLHHPSGSANRCFAPNGSQQGGGTHLRHTCGVGAAGRAPPPSERGAKKDWHGALLPAAPAR
jgi:hypothetical protein